MNEVDWSFLPTLNAALNGVAATLLVVGLILIKQRRIHAHRACMIAALLVSSLFLVSYVLHKIWRASQDGDLHKEFNATGWMKSAYLVLLFSHLILAMAVPFLAIWLVRLGLKREDARHRRLARVAFPIWLYVSFTGVLIYILLYHMNPEP